MEKYKKVCSVVTPVGEPDQYGNNAFSIGFADGSTGFFKCKEQNLFQVGVESEFYMGKATGKSGKEYSKIERVEKHENAYENNSGNFPSGPGKSKSNPDDSVKFMCLSYAKDIMIAFNGKMPSPTEVVEYAEVLYSETKNGKAAKELTGHEAALTPPSEEPTDVLPF